MPSLWKEMKKVINQIRGTQNIFGYKSTVANQIYLFYCFCGKIYFTNKVDRGVKYLWYTYVCFALTILNLHVLMYILYDEERDLIVMFNVSNIFGCVNWTTFGYPLMAYIFDNQITALIEKIDNILTLGEGHSVVNSAKQSRVIVGVKSMFLLIIAPFLTISLAHLLICSLDVVLFYSDDKVKNDFYYMSPIPLVRQHGTFGLFIFLTGLSALYFGLVLLQSSSAMAVIIYWNAVCCNELNDMRDELYDRSRSLMEDMKKCVEVGRGFEEWNQNFNGIMRRGIVIFQDTILLVNYLRTYFEVIGSLVVILCFLYDVVVLYIALNEEIFVLKLKYAIGCLATSFLPFAFYLTGQNLENSVIDVSTAVYSTPWYCSVKVRKITLILLCQTQTVKNLAIIKVYGMVLKNFSRFANGVISYTNVLRSLNLK